MFNSILVVCTGNICRSPIAERLLRKMLPHKVIDSAGTKAMVNHRADPSSVRVAYDRGLMLDGHRGCQFTSQLAAKYDLIIVMEKSHITEITDIAPEARSKCMLLGHWMERTEIPDPWRQSDEAFEHVYQLIDQACQTWISKIR